MSDVYIVGAGIHPFGRTEGRTGRQQGVVRRACGIAATRASNGATCSSRTAGPTRPATRMRWSNNSASRGCSSSTSQTDARPEARRCSARTRASSRGEFDLGIAIGFDKHPRGAFDPKPADWGLPDWYGETVSMLTTQFFAMKLHRYMHEYGITPPTLARGGRESVRERRGTPHAWRRKPVGIETIMDSPMINDPLTKYMFCSPGEGGVALVSRARGRRASWVAGVRAPRAPRCARGRPARSRCSRRRWTLERGRSPSARLARRVRDGRRRSGRHRRRTAPGHRERRRDHAHGRERFLRRWRTGGLAGRGRDAARRRAAGQHRRRLSGLRRADRRIGPAPGHENVHAAARRRRRATGRRKLHTATARSTARPACRPS